MERERERENHPVRVAAAIKSATIDRERGFFTDRASIYEKGVGFERKTRSWTIRIGHPDGNKDGVVNGY